MSKKINLCSKVEIVPVQKWNTSSMLLSQKPSYVTVSVGNNVTNINVTNITHIPKSFQIKKIFNSKFHKIETGKIKIF